MSFIKIKKNTSNKFFTLTLSALVCFSLAGCDLARNYTKPDRAGNMEIQDFRDGMAERLPETEPAAGGNNKMVGIPELQPYVSTSVANIKPMPLVSVSVNQSVPIRDVLFELAEQAEYDIELDPNIRGSIIFTARNKPFDRVIERISDIAGLRYKFNEDSLRVELDTPYNKIYKVDYLSFIRNNAGSVSTNVSVVTGDGADTGSTFSASSESTSDFWGELETNISQILGGAVGSGLRTNSDPRITAAEQNPSSDELGGGGDDEDNTPEVILNVESLPVDDTSSSSGGEEGSTTTSTFSLNRQAGIINVFANGKQHKELADYLTELRRSVTSQVLIEAKIFEVNLFDEYITGIDWQALNLKEGFGNFLSTAGATSLNSVAGGATRGLITPPAGALATTNNFTLGYAGNDLEALVQAISGFGTVRALASPRLTTLNNQSAVLNVATNQVFFEISVESTDDDDDGDIDTVEVDTTINSVPEGVLVNVQPSINLSTRKISLALRPTITRIVGTVRDPGVAFVAATIPGASNLQSEVPEVNVQEIDTVVNVSSGQPIVMGGLLQDRIVNTQEGVPVLGEMPLVGSLFRTQNDLIQKTELVIFIKATIIDNGDETIHSTDKDLYRKFSSDRRPLKL